MNSLHSMINGLAAEFAQSILAAILSTPLDQLVGQDGSPSELAAQPATRGKVPKAAKPAKRGGGRLVRRSQEDIDAIGVKVLDILGKDGLRAEDIKTQLKLERKEIPRILKSLIGSRQVKKSGNKRMTVYALAGAGGKGASKSAKPAKPAKPAKKTAKKPVAKVAKVAATKGGRKPAKKVTTNTPKKKSAAPKAPAASTAPSADPPVAAPKA